MKRYLPFVIIAIVLGTALGVGALLFRSAKPQTPAASNPSTTSSASPTAPATSDVVTIEEYGDYQCPPCGSLHPVLRTLKNEYGNRLKLVFYHFPLTSAHKHALEAAYAAAAAGLQGKFWEMHDKLYENQSIWSDVGDFRPVALNFARQIGLDVAQFTRDMDGLKVMSMVSVDTQRGNALGVDSTPTVFINGQLISNDNLTPEALRKEINRRLPAKE